MELVDARNVLVWRMIGDSKTDGMWIRLGRSLTPVVQVPGLTKVAVLYRPHPTLDSSPLPTRKA